MVDSEITRFVREIVTTGEPAQKVICVADLDADDELRAEAFEIYGLSKEHGWLLLTRVDAKQYGFDLQSAFYHRVLKVVISGQRAQVKFSKADAPEA